MGQSKGIPERSFDILLTYKVAKKIVKPDKDRKRKSPRNRVKSTNIERYAKIQKMDFGIRDVEVACSNHVTPIAVETL